MQTKQKTSLISLGILIAVIVATLLAAFVSTHIARAEGCDDIETSIIQCDDSKGGNPIYAILIMVLNILTGGVGIVAVGGMIYASILYASAENNAQQTAKAKEIIRNVVIGLVAYALMFSFLQYIVPGGVFNV